jgi:Tfp pilus assembly protein PilP
MRKLLFAVALLAACGDDDNGAGATRPNGAPAAAPAAKAAADKNKLQPRMHVEDKISCPVPDAPTGHPACTPVDQPTTPNSKLLPDCDPGSYCMQVGNTYTCEPCAERESIRHEFKDRDFVQDQSRDPFEDYVILQPGLGAGSNTSKPEPHQTCKRPDQFVATGYSYQDLKLVGIVAQGTMRKAVLMDTRPYGWIVKRGDCVGKEKAVVKDIGAGYITFVAEEDPDNKRPAQESTQQLHPGGLDSEPPPTSQPTPGPVTPVVPPPVSPPTGR